MGTSEIRKNAVIFGSVEQESWDFLLSRLPADFSVICADGGVICAQKTGLLPDVVIGDNDSGGANAKCPVQIVLPAEKALTDMQAAIDYALEDGFQSLILTGCTGGRLDHLFANLFLLEYASNRGAECIMLDQYHEIYFLKNSSKILTCTENFRYFSLIPVGEMVSGVSISGAKYPLNNQTVSRGDTLCISNEPQGDKTEIEVNNGSMFLICTKLN